MMSPEARQRIQFALLLALVVATTVKVVWYVAVAGAPVKVTVGLIFVALVDWVKVAVL